MTFTHLNKIKIERQFVKQLDTKEGHYYELKDGTIVPSITTVKSKVADMSWYPHWIASIMRKNPNMSEEEAKIEANRIGDSSMRVGTELHRLAECYLNNDEVTCTEPFDDPYEKDPIELFDVLKTWLDEHIDNIYATESKMYSKELGLAGTVDWVAEFDGVLTIGDFKNARKYQAPGDILKKKHYEQICAYGKMFEECYGIKVEQGVIVVISWDGRVRPFKVNLKDYESGLYDILIQYESTINI